MQKYLFLLLLLAFFQACVEPPDYPEGPELEFVSLNKDTILQGSPGNNDELRITFSFTDGDGDLGTEPSKPIVLTDMRDGSQEWSFGFDAVPELGAANGISGEMTVIINTGFSGVCCIYERDDQVSPCGQPSILEPIDTLIYQIQVTDRAGNVSNVIQTPPIFVLCQ
jgi:hypothetical protein